MNKITLQDIQEQFDFGYMLGYYEEPLDFYTDKIDIDLIVVAQLRYNGIELNFKFKRDGKTESEDIPDFMSEDTQVADWILEVACIGMAYRLDRHNLRLDDIFDDSVISASNLQIHLSTDTANDS